MGVKYYLIRNTKDQDFAWSNDLGWVDDFSLDLFDEDEVQYLNLPIDGEWESVPDHGGGDYD